MDGLSLTRIHSKQFSRTLTFNTLVWKFRNEEWAHARFLDFFLKLTLKLPEVFHLQSTGKESSSIISSYFGSFDSYCILWGQISEENLLNAQFPLLPVPFPRFSSKRSWMWKNSSKSRLMSGNCSQIRNPVTVRNQCAFGEILIGHPDTRFNWTGFKWLSQFPENSMRLLMTCPLIIETLWQKTDTSHWCNLFDRQHFLQFARLLIWVDSSSTNSTCLNLSVSPVFAIGSFHFILCVLHMFDLSWQHSKFSIYIFYRCVFCWTPWYWIISHFMTGGEGGELCQ